MTAGDVFECEFVGFPLWCMHVLVDLGWCRITAVVRMLRVGREELKEDASLFGYDCVRVESTRRDNDRSTILRRHASRSMGGCRRHRQDGEHRARKTTRAVELYHDTQSRFIVGD